MRTKENDKAMKPKILFIMHMPPPVHGAAMVGQYIHDSKLINEKFDCHYINLTTAKNLQDIGKGGVRKIFKFVGLLAKIIKGVVTVRPSLVYVTPNACGGAFYKDFVVVKLLKTLGCKVVVHYHNKGVATRQDRRLDDWLYRRFFRNIKVILLADVLYHDVEKYVRKENVYICPNGIPETLGVEPKVELHNSVPHLLFLSNLIVSKGVFVLLDALQILKDKGYAFVCDFVGGETDEIDANRFEEEVKKRGLQNMVIYQGKKYGEEKNKEYVHSDVFVFPTFYYNECFPLVLLEAMEHHVACISTTEGGISGIIEDGKTGFLVKKHDSSTLAEKIEYLITHPDERNQMGEKGYQKFQNEFTLRKFEERLAGILGNCY